MGFSLLNHPAMGVPPWKPPKIHPVAISKISKKNGGNHQDPGLNGAEPPGAALLIGVQQLLPEPFSHGLLTVLLWK